MVFAQQVRGPPSDSPTKGAKDRAGVYHGNTILGLQSYPRAFSPGLYGVAPSLRTDIDALRGLEFSSPAGARPEWFQATDRISPAESGETLPRRLRQ